MASNHVEKFLETEFMDEEAENFFIQFEKIATLREWPEEEWALLVQTKLRGKAREAVASLNVEECREYWVVKEAVLQTAIVDPEVYRRRFRDVKMLPNQTHLEMARECILKYGKWKKAECVRRIEEVDQMVMMEQFMNNLKPEMKYEIVRLDIKDILEAGRKADQLKTVHGSSKDSTESKGRPNHQGWNGNPGGFKNGNRSTNYYGGGVSHAQSYGHSKYTNEYAKPTGNQVQNQAVYSSPFKGNNVNDTPRQGNPRIRCYTCGEVGHLSMYCDHQQAPPRCQYCGKLGHKRNQCYQLKGSKEAGLAVSRCESLKKRPSINCFKKVLPAVEFKPFITEGHIRVDEGEERKIEILRDTGANLSLVLRDTVEWSDNTFTGEEVDIVGIGTSSVIIPVHYVWIKSGFIKGRVKVGVSDKLPVSGVDMLLGNDLAGNIVVPNPELVENPISEKDDKILEPEIYEDKGKEEKIEIYPACVVTRAEAKGNEKIEENEMGLNSLFDEVESDNEVRPMKISDADCEAEVLSDFVAEKEGLNWEQHLELLEEVFKKLNEANLTVNLAKSDFVKASVDYLGFKVGQGEVRPLTAKIISKAGKVRMEWTL
ncbi:hypothetical protein Pcinc_009233 [Petrolisthes cinctipes]|uniref:CCHC-type domain-containing protein n=1 Tax=Petrolisthes cinctipes TaxID=88211 RepID=A0AAE1KYN5_PETCI|nr:hypothetical protein Pcinc_009233 [Petrolisthes cinctipes]